MAFSFASYLQKSARRIFRQPRIISSKSEGFCKMYSSIPVYFVDAFTVHGNSAFTGNPAAVCFLDSDEDIPDETKQKITSEVNQNITAFVSHRWSKSLSSHAGKSPFSSNNTQLIWRTLRWFLPTHEIPLCGHGTVASTKAIVDHLLDKEPDMKESRKNILIQFETRFGGLLGASFDCKSERISITFPSSPSTSCNSTPSNEKWIEEMIDATLTSELPSDSVKDIHYSPSAKIVLLRLADNFNENDIRRISPDFQKLIAIENCNDMFGVSVTVKGKNPDVGQAEPHFYSRFFAPWVGVNEDPVCGAAHTVLTPYWTKEYFNGFGKTLLARQHSIRGGNLHCTLVDADKVTLAGEARIIIKGEIVVP